MKTKKKVKLLKILLSSIGLMNTEQIPGLCGLIVHLRNKEIFTMKEEYALLSTIRENKPNRSNIFYFSMFEIEPRKEFLNKIISDLEKKKIKVDLSIANTTDWFYIKYKYKHMEEEFFLKGDFFSNNFHTYLYPIEDGFTPISYSNIAFSKSDEIVEFRKATQEEIGKFEPKSVRYDNIKKLRGYYIDTLSEIEEYLNTNKNTINKNVCRLESDCKKILAFSQLTQIAYKCNGCDQNEIKEGWTFKFNKNLKNVITVHTRADRNQYPFEILFSSKEDLELSFEQDREIWNDYFEIT